MTLDTVSLVELLMFDAWCNTPVFRGMIFLLGIWHIGTCFRKGIPNIRCRCKFS